MNTRSTVSREISSICFRLLHNGSPRVAGAVLASVSMTGEPELWMATLFFSLGVAWLVAPFLRLPRGRHERGA